MPSKQMPVVSVSREPLRAAAMSSSDAAAYMGVAPGTLSNWRLAGRGPRYVRIGDGPKAKVLYRVVDLDEWLEAQLVGGNAA